MNEFMDEDEERRDCGLNKVLYGGLWSWKCHLNPDPSLSSERERDTAQFGFVWFPWRCLSEWCQRSCFLISNFWQRVKRSPRWAEGEDKVLLKLRTWLIVKLDLGRVDGAGWASGGASKGTTRHRRAAQEKTRRRLMWPALKKCNAIKSHGNTI